MKNTTLARVRNDGWWHNRGSDWATPQDLFDILDKEFHRKRGFGKMNNIIHKLLVFIHLRSEVGFMRLMYRGLPVVLRDNIPNNKIGFIGKDSKVRLLNWKTGKHREFKNMYAFERWIEKQNRNLKKHE